MINIDDLILDDDAYRFKDCDSAVIGSDQRCFLVYDYNKLVEVFRNHGMNYDEAVDYVEFNVVGVKPDNYTILYPKTDETIL